MSPRPYTIISAALSWDGKLSLPGRLPARLGTRRDREGLMNLRAECDAVLAGAATVTRDRLTLGLPRPALRRARISRELSPVPLRAVVSGRLNLSPDLPLFDPDIGSPLVLFCSRAAAAGRRERFCRCADLYVCGASSVDPRAALGILRVVYGVRRLLVEGGGRLNGWLLRASLVDELRLTFCPLLVGGSDAATLADGPGFPISRAPRARLARWAAHDGEVEATYLLRPRA